MVYKVIIFNDKFKPTSSAYGMVPHNTKMAA
jgi:hypothetical protein